MPLPHCRGRLAATTGTSAAVVVALVALAAPASAHVTVSPDTATQGGYAKLTLRVPTEVDDASTVKVQVFFPASEPLASVSVKPHPGWSYQVTTTRLSKPVASGNGSISRAVSKITWTANTPSSAIKPGQFDEFDISAGPLPTASSMELKALQTYSDGHVVRWIESGTPGGAEPAHPAPVLTLVPAGDTADHGSTPTSAAPSGHDTTALVLSIVALVIAVATAGAGVLRRSRS